MANELTLEIEEEIATICLNRPEVHNAVDGATMALLEDALDRIEREGARAVIITGAGEQTFCSGGDLRYFASFDEGEEKQVLSMAHRMQNILKRLAHGPRVVIGAVNGNSFGGGCEILTACHFRISIPEASFSFRQAANGIITGWGGGYRLFRLIGRGRALKLLLTADEIEAEEARRIGLVDEIVPRPILMDAARFLASKVIRNNPAAVGAFLELADRLDEEDYDTFHERELHMFSELWINGPFAELLEKYR